MSVGATPAPDRSDPGPRRRWRTLLIVAAVLAALLLAFAFWFSRPSQVARLVLGQAGSALGLEITSSGASEYRLRGTPHLVVRDVVARMPGASEPLLVAERLRLSLPWSTLRARGADLTVERVEADAPRLDIEMLGRWLDSRPPSTTDPRIPTLTEGLHIVRGQVIGSGWSIEGVNIDLPSLAPSAPVAARVDGRFVNGDTSVPFDLQLALTAPSQDAALGASGIATVVTPDWRLALKPTLSGLLFQGENGFGLDRMRFASPSRLTLPDQSHRFALGLAGPLRYRDGMLSIEPMGLATRGGGLVPTLAASGGFAWQEHLSLQLGGEFAGWPEAWPVLPEPLARPSDAMPFRLTYSGATNLSGPAHLELATEGSTPGTTRLAGDFRLPEILEWLEQLDRGNPLPPVDGTFETPRLELAGATLHGVRVEMSDGSDEAGAGSE
ncbi:hypothetical protein [Novilysobacter spongiicola]|uniref:AsmA family protein n=1 Tax=Lysobacter spongiicola DSM 21749 TaxID=1122188 RepID=A0A1T4N792_9GAMM|nr:hypothetical protein [Lysobacter spongiicola]SJZ75104.1 hypothetical protein SAMN02745674_00760 [Lysobacter spongiicola DSM 21749]